MIRFKIYNFNYKTFLISIKSKNKKKEDKIEINDVLLQEKIEIIIKENKNLVILNKK